ncbi:uncharacterized protein LOC144926351 [Branchiostoma floridae x Branchiostoma belcheri]
MAQALSYNTLDQTEGGQCTVGKIIQTWVRGKQEECLDIVHRNEERFRERVQNALDELHRAHKIDPLKIGIQDIKYEDPFFQFGYTYKHSMFSARSLSKVMHCSDVLGNLGKRTSITVVCLGGGPGSDVLGVLDYFMKYMGDFEGQLDIQLYDRKDKWGTCWESLKTAMDTELHDPRVRVSFHDFDVTTADLDSYKNKPDLQNADVITMHYFMEEVYSERERAEVVECCDHIIQCRPVMECFEYIVQTSKPGALFLYSGMFMIDTMDWVHQLLQDNCELLTPGTEPPRKETYRTPEWIPCIEVDLHQEGDLNLLDDIRADLEIHYETKQVSQRYRGEVVYRLYRRK